ncbi:hypothetical protein [Benzoatithermus flavus]|uniref:Uncharacterized protein n=1 Tax=Benzoatithermus flavus TaxID=3108223 RepID=A0ABU8XRB1_9PROT
MRLAAIRLWPTPGRVDEQQVLPAVDPAAWRRAANSGRVTSRSFSRGGLVLEQERRVLLEGKRRETGLVVLRGERLGHGGAARRRQARGDGRASDRPCSVAVALAADVGVSRGLGVARPPPRGRRRAAS